MRKFLGIFTAFGVSLATPLPAAAEPALLLGVFGNWTAYSSGSGSEMTCFALSRPRATRPKTAKRGAIFLMVSDWPARKIKAEPQIVYGYQGKEGGAAALGVGGDKFTFFIKNTGKEGSAWLQQLGENPRLIAAMQDGVSAVASGISQRGTKTSDTYSLAGFNDALAKIHAVCQM
ncbi:MAG TPA: hypothetical protein VJL82_01840 [Rhizomicrobium sp.]|nr:hypothetical protein [Rhizomicrobium sp.]